MNKVRKKEPARWDPGGIGRNELGGTGTTQEELGGPKRFQQEPFYKDITRLSCYDHMITSLNSGPVQ